MRLLRIFITLLARLVRKYPLPKGGSEAEACTVSKGVVPLLCIHREGLQYILRIRSKYVAVVASSLATCNVCRLLFSTPVTRAVADAFSPGFVDQDVATAHSCNNGDRNSFPLQRLKRSVSSKRTRWTWQSCRSSNDKKNGCDASSIRSVPKRTKWSEQ